MKFRNVKFLNLWEFHIYHYFFFFFSLFPRTLLEVWLWIDVDSGSPRTSTPCLSRRSSCRVTPLSKVSAPSAFNESGVVVWVFDGFAHKAFCNRSLFFVFASSFSLSTWSSSYCSICHSTCSAQCVYGARKQSCASRRLRKTIRHIAYEARMLISALTCWFASAVLFRCKWFCSRLSPDCNKYACNSSFMRLLRQMRLHIKPNPH